MAVALTHVGEAIVQSLIERSPAVFFALCGLPFTEVHGGHVLREARLKPHAGCAFDGASRIDLVVPLRVDEAVPVEVKLGETRLSKHRVETEWLRGCGTSHNDARSTGNMMSVLDQLIPAGASERLVAAVDGSEYPLTLQWYVVVRRSTARSWSGDARPGFARATIVALEDLLADVTPAEFDDLVRRLLPRSFYESWIAGA